MSVDSSRGILNRRSQGASLLDRVDSRSKNSPLSEIQSETDRLVENALATSSDGKTLAALVGAGLAGRWIRLGSAASLGSSAGPMLLQGVSHTAALAGESAVFAGMERKFAEWEGHRPTQPFQKDWARAFINLGSLKILGGAARGQNILIQHLLADTGMVAGHHLGHAAGVVGKPEGSLARQLIEAEGMNLGMKGATALLRGFSPGLLALERSLDLALSTPNTPTVPEGPSIFFPQIFAVAESPSGGAFQGFEKPEGLNILRMSEKGDSEGRGPKDAKVIDFGERKLVKDLKTALTPPSKEEVEGPGESPAEDPVPQNVRTLTPPQPFQAARIRNHLGSKLDTPNFELKKLLVILLGNNGDPGARPQLEKVLEEDPHPHVRLLALGSLAKLGDASARAAMDREFIDADPKGKSLLISTWAEMGDVEAQVSLRKAQRYPDAEIQKKAAAMLERLNPPPPEPPVAPESEPVPLPDLVLGILFNVRASLPQTLEMAEKARDQARTKIGLVDLNALVQRAHQSLENILAVSPVQKLATALRVADGFQEGTLNLRDRERLFPIFLRRLIALEQLSFALDFYEKFERRETQAATGSPRLPLNQRMSFQQGVRLLTLMVLELDPKARQGLLFKIEQGKDRPETAEFAKACLARIGEISDYEP